jgi:uncharacterized membrane protein YkvA (DUF1232 family)
MTTIERLRQWARRIKRDGVALWFASRDARTPWGAKALCVFVVAYALSPIDLIPDFIPVLGYLDDVLLLPALMWLAIRLVPEQVMQESRVAADQWMQVQGERPRSWAGAGLIVALWLALAWLLWRAASRWPW